MHLNTETALDFIEGRLNQDQEAFWKKHMDGCIECRKDLLRWQQVAVDLRMSHLKSASEEELATAARILVPAEPKEHLGLRSIVASIMFDSFRQPELAGVRGGVGGVGRQLVMRAEEFDIHIKVWGNSDRRQMLGQLLPRNGKIFTSGARFHLLRNGERLESTMTDQLGEFHFEYVPEGDLSLQIDLPNLTVIGALNIQESS
jgi:hypothetical protein